MKKIFNTVLLIFSYSLHLCANENDSKVWSFTPKQMTEVVQRCAPGDASFDGVRPPIIQIFTLDKRDDLKICIRMRSVGITSAENNHISYRQLDGTALKEELKTLISPPIATNVTPIVSVKLVSPVVDTKLGGQKAISASFSRVLRNSSVFLGMNEIYWVRVQTNRVVEVTLTTRSNSEEQLNTLRKCLSNFKISTE